MTEKAGRDLKDIRERDAAEGVERGTDRGLSTGGGAEAIATSSGTTLLAFLEPARRPFTAYRFAARGSDAAAGLIYLSLYRIAKDDLKAASWTARKSFTVSVALPTSIGTVMVGFTEPKDIDPRSLWMVGVRTANSLTSVRGTDAGTPPGLDGFSVASADPATILSASATRQRLIPSVQLLSLSGLRLRSS